jgi:hypothetical protein
VPEAGSLWQLEGFLERLDLWAENETSSDDLRFIVTEWIITRQDDPYQGVRREPGFDNLWFGVIPDSQDGKGRIVTCAYWIQEATHTLRCDSFATLHWPA